MALAASGCLDVAALAHLVTPYADRLLLEPPATGTELVPAAAFADPEQVRLFVQRYAARLGAEDLRAAASIWNKHYNAAVLMGVLKAMTLGGIGLDARPANASLTLQDDLPRAMLLHDLSGSLVCEERLGHGLPGLESVGASGLHRLLCEGAIAGHLAPVIEALRTAFGISRRILWGNVGNLVADLFDKWGEQPAAVREDRRFLLDDRCSPLLPGKPNPLWDCVRYEALAEPDLPPVVRVRRTCCQKSHLPGGKACTTCPLVSVEERVTLLRAHQA